MYRCGLVLVQAITTALAPFAAAGLPLALVITVLDLAINLVLVTVSTVLGAVLGILGGLYVLFFFLDFFVDRGLWLIFGNLGLRTSRCGVRLDSLRPSRRSGFSKPLYIRNGVYSQGLNDNGPSQQQCLLIFTSTRTFKTSKCK